MTDPKASAEPQEMTPEARAIIGRARRSFLFSIGLLIVGFIAIGGALVYRAASTGGSTTAPAAASDYVIASMPIPTGAQIVSAVAADGLVTVTYSVGTLTSVRVFDGKTGNLLREIPIVSE